VQGTGRECFQLISFVLGVVAKGCSFVFRTAEQSTPEACVPITPDAIRIDFKILSCPTVLDREVLFFDWSASVSLAVLLQPRRLRSSPPGTLVAPESAEPNSVRKIRVVSRITERWRSACVRESDSLGSCRSN